MALATVTRQCCAAFAAFFLAAMAPSDARAQTPPVEIVPQLGHSGELISVAFSPGGKTALSGSDDKTLRLWDLASGREIRRFAGHSDKVTSVAIAPDGKTALSGSADNTLRLWDLASGREIRKFLGHSEGVDSVAISPDGKTALSGWRNCFWRAKDLGPGQRPRDRKIRGGFGPGPSVAISPDGKTALSGGRGQSALRLWDLASGREIRIFEGHSRRVNSVAFSPDGKTVLSGERRTMTAKALGSGQRAARSENSRDIRSQVNSVAIAPDGKTALSASSDKTLRLWDLASGPRDQKNRGAYGRRPFGCPCAGRQDGAVGCFT